MPHPTMLSRLRRDYTALAVIDALRQESGNPRLGATMELAILETELRDIDLATQVDEVDQEIRKRGGRGQRGQ